MHACRPRPPPSIHANLGMHAGRLGAPPAPPLQPPPSWHALLHAGRGSNLWTSPPGCLMFSCSQALRVSGHQAPFINYLVCLAILRGLTDAVQAVAPQVGRDHLEGADGCSRSGGTSGGWGPQVVGDLRWLGTSGGWGPQVVGDLKWLGTSGGWGPQVVGDLRWLGTSGGWGPQEVGDLRWLGTRGAVIAGVNTALGGGGDQW